MNKIIQPRIAAIVPAAGIGSRMKSSCPKQYLKINSKTVIEYTLSTLLAHPKIEQVVVALSPQDSCFLTLDVAQDPRVITVVGAADRANSVMAGLQVLNNYDWVLVHDAARPCLHFSDLELLIEKAMRSKAGGILATPVRDTMKQAMIGSYQISHTVERTYLWHALTPQMFPLELLQACLTRAIDERVSVTDEASAMEYCGIHPLLVQGRADNIKITQPEDLTLATFYLNQFFSEAN